MIIVFDTNVYRGLVSGVEIDDIKDYAVQFCEADDVHYYSRRVIKSPA